MSLEDHTSRDPGPWSVHSHYSHKRLTCLLPIVCLSGVLGRRPRLLVVVEEMFCSPTSLTRSLSENQTPSNLV